ncbi:reticulocalbin-2 [Aplysia californica]|uniref:Reticulocalbin-2 n=1 Tax=Aplysia californica TaxID=6500 RepID=A0ABM0K365_APLCA|nr:reticulocalbin-2 [Aplysia californica]
MEFRNKLCLFTVAVLCILPVCLGEVERPEHGGMGTKTHHAKGGIHNPVFDQEALLGSHDLEELAELDEDVRTQRLKNLAKSHDANDNDIIELDELKEWILQSFRLLDHEEAMERWNNEDEDGDGKLTFSEILNKQFSVTEEELSEMENADEEEKDTDVLQLVADDKKRFAAADLNQDGSLDENEFLAYFQPYDYPHMFEVEIERTMKEMDKDGDGSVSMEEFIGDEVDEESRLVEVTNFEDLDKDKDGKLSREEVRPWALPDNNEVAVEEAEHLLESCDEDGDKQLTIDEIVSKEEEFLASSATDYGRTLHYVKDEL